MPATVAKEIEDYQTLSLAFQDVLGVMITEDQRVNTIEKLHRVMQSNQLGSIVDLAEKMRHYGSNHLNAEVLEAITVTDSSWFQYPSISQCLKNYVLGNLRDTARIWVVGCGDGALAYSVAIDVAQYNRNHSAKNISIIATDVSSENISHAEAACYPDRRMSNVSESKRAHFMMKHEKTEEGFDGVNDEIWEMKASIREMLSFQQCDLLEDFSHIGLVDVIICPDSLLYLSNSTRSNVLDGFSSLLTPGGILLVGENQTVMSQRFERVDHAAGVFFRQRS